MKFLFLIASLFFLFLASAQESLRFVELRSEPAQCRLYDFQSGNGVLYCAASGGVPDYSYSWLDIQTGVSFGSSFWGGVNTGYYEITVTDAVGTMIVDTVFVDSILPKALLDVASEDLIGGPIYFEGKIGSEVKFINESNLYLAEPAPSRGVFFFRASLHEDFKLYKVGEFEDSDYLNFDSPYIYSKAEEEVAELIHFNRNGCSDTTRLFFKIIPNDPKPVISYVENKISIQLPFKHLGMNFQLFTITGQEVFTAIITEEIATIYTNDIAKSSFVYRLIDKNTHEVVFTGKVVHRY
ncbi:hypothetical protein [Crocinitomix catalasitica]|uniref:hypothetical protein n=1 Tax=Crocinitomix catalasitica TaxID=184607 RepID=UPI000486B736|nr:hypothetical protein [Crocinitomix catalasitica]